MRKLSGDQSYYFATKAFFPHCKIVVFQHIFKHLNTIFSLVDSRFVELVCFPTFTFPLFSLLPPTCTNMEKWHSFFHVWGRCECVMPLFSLVRCRGESVAKERRLDRCRGNLLPSSCNVWSHSASSRCAHCVHVFFSLCDPLEEGSDIFDTWKCRNCHKNNISYVRFTYGHLETPAHTPFPLNSAIFMRRNTFATKYKRDGWSLRWKRNIKTHFLRHTHMSRPPV